MPASPPESRKDSTPLALWATVALLLLAAQGAALRTLATAPYSWSNPGPGRSVGLLPPDVERAAPWTAVLEATQKRKADGDLADLAREGAARAGAVGRAYTAMLAVLTPAQRAAIEHERTDLIDPLFPGMNGDTHPLADFCLAALDAPDTAPFSSPEDASGPSTPVPADLPMPQVIVWGITRLARTPGPEALSDAQKSALAPLVEDAAARAEAWQRNRAALASRLGLPPLESPEPIVSMPAPQELRRVQQALSVWASTR